MANAESAAGRTLQLLLLSVVAMAGMYARAELGPLQEALRASLSLTDEQIALLQGPALAVPLLICAVPLGLWVDTYPRKRILAIAAFGNVMATVIGGATREFEVLFATRCVVGICAPLTTIAAYSLVSDIYGLDKRGRATTVVVLGAIAGAALAFALGGELLAISGLTSENWHRVMLRTAWLLLPAVGVAMLLHEAPRKERGFEAPSFSSVREQLRRHWAVIVVLLTGWAMVNLADGASLVWTAPTLSRTFDLSAARTGTITGAAIFLGGIAGPLLGGPLADMCQRSSGPGRTVLLLGVMALLSVPAGLFGAMPGISLTVCSMLLFLILGNAICVAVVALTISVIPNELRGMSMTLQWGVGAVFGFGVAPLAVASLSTLLGGTGAIGQALAIVCASTSLFGALTFLCSGRVFRGLLQGNANSLGGE